METTPGSQASSIQNPNHAEKIRLAPCHMGLFWKTAEMWLRARGSGCCHECGGLEFRMISSTIRGKLVFQKLLRLSLIFPYTHIAGTVDHLTMRLVVMSKIPRSGMNPGLHSLILPPLRHRSIFCSPRIDSWADHGCLITASGESTWILLNSLQKELVFSGKY